MPQKQTQLLQFILEELAHVIANGHSKVLSDDQWFRQTQQMIRKLTPPQQLADDMDDDSGEEEPDLSHSPTE